LAFFIKGGLFHNLQKLWGESEEDKSLRRGVLALKSTAIEGQKPGGGGIRKNCDPSTFARKYAAESKDAQGGAKKPGNPEEPTKPQPPKKNLGIGPELPKHISKKNQKTFKAKYQKKKARPCKETKVSSGHRNAG